MHLSKAEGYKLRVFQTSSKQKDDIKTSSLLRKDTASHNCPLNPQSPMPKLIVDICSRLQTAQNQLAVRSSSAPKLLQTKPSFLRLPQKLARYDRDLCEEQDELCDHRKPPAPHSMKAFESVSPQQLSNQLTEDCRKIASFSHSVLSKQRQTSISGMSTPEQVSGIQQSFDLHRAALMDPNLMFNFSTIGKHGFLGNTTGKFSREGELSDRSRNEPKGVLKKTPSTNKSLAGDQESPRKLDGKKVRFSKSRMVLIFRQRTDEQTIEQVSVDYGFRSPPLKPRKAIRGTRYLK